MIPTREQIKEKALELGWKDIGITSATLSEDNIHSYKEWIKKGKHADLSYMENQMRCDPQSLFPGAKTAILFISYYKQERKNFEKNSGVIASYARGKNYHNVHHKRLKKMIQWLESVTQQKNIAKGFSDSAPVLEKALAVQAGLGWFGKNTLLIHRYFGTFTLLSGLFTTLELPETILEKRLPKCGVCTRCLDACPVGALESPYVLNANKCLSYHLIESKKDIPLEIQKKNPGYIFGCDICQDVCPHNVRKENSTDFAFSLENGPGSTITTEDLYEWEKEPEKLFGTSLQRRKVKGLKYSAETLNLK